MQPPPSLFPQLALQTVPSDAKPIEQLVAPFKWRGGKRRVAPQVWERFGRVGHYSEPFLGGAAVLLARPDPAGLETVNDLNGHLVNFWRSLKLQPELVAHHGAGHPPGGLGLAPADLARRRRVAVAHRRERLRRDGPETTVETGLHPDQLNAWRELGAGILSHLQGERAEQLELALRG